jgi:Fe-S cluster biogenesis protein NfuA
MARRLSQADHVQIVATLGIGHEHDRAAQHPDQVDTLLAVPQAGIFLGCTPNPVSHGSGSTCTAAPNDGYTFSAFSGACYGATCNLINVTGARSVTAIFRLKTYPITATANPAVGGSVTCSPNPVSHGSDSSCTATSWTGYTFSGFSGACTGAACALTNVTSAQSVTGNFTAKTYPITAIANPVAGGTVVCTPNPVAHGSGSTCTAAPATGYRFSSFSGACYGATCALTNVNAAKTVTATFTR